VTNGVEKLQPTVRSTVETCQTSFDPCVVNHVGFLLSPSYPQSVLDALHVVHLVCCRLLKVRKERVQVWVRHFDATAQRCVETLDIVGPGGVVSDAESLQAN